MDIYNRPPASSLTTQPISADLNKLLDQLGTRVGESVNASVSKLIDVTAEERSILLQLKGQSPEWKNVLNSEQLRLAILKVGNARLLHTLTDQAIKTGQTVQIERLPSGNFRLHWSTPHANALTPTNSAKADSSITSTLVRPDSTNHGSVQIGDTRPSAVPTKMPEHNGPIKNSNNAPQTTNPRPNLLPEQEVALIEALKQSLPYQVKLGLFFKQMLAVTQAFNQLNTQTQQALVSPQVKSALVKLEQWFTQSTNSLEAKNTSPTAVKNLLNNAGPMLENKLFRLVHETLTKSVGKPDLPIDLKTQTRIATIFNNKIIAEDLKALLIKLDSATQLVHSDSPNTTYTKPDLVKPGAVDEIIKLLLGFPAKIDKNAKELPFSRAQINHHLHQLAQSGLARIQLLQQQSLGDATNENVTRGTQLHYELPLRFQDGIGNLFLSLQQLPLEWDEKEEQPEKKGADELGQKWQIFMEFDLDEYGSFATQISLINETLSAQFWASLDATRNETQNSLHILKNQLEAKGIHVQQLECNKEQPPQQKMQLNYSLVDIST